MDVCSRPVVQLLNVREVQGSLGAGTLAVAAHITVQVPEDAQFSRDDRIGVKDAPAGKVRTQSFEHDDIRRQQQERSGIVLATFSDGVEVLPGDRQCHDLGLAATRRHLDGVAGELIELQHVDARHGGVAFDQVTMTADTFDLEQVDQRFNGLPLGRVVGEESSAGRPVVGCKPVIEKQLGGLGRALVLAITPFGHGLADCRHARRRGDTGVEQAGLGGSRSRLSSGHDPAP